MLRSAFQNVWQLAGRSPWPVVEMEMSTTECCSSCLWGTSQASDSATGRLLLTYKIDGVQFGDLGVEPQALGNPTQLFSNVLGVACLGAIEDQGSTPLHCARHDAIERAENSARRFATAIEDTVCVHGELAALEG